jgi:hypothetical protein
VRFRGPGAAPDADPGFANSMINRWALPWVNCVKFLPPLVIEASLPVSYKP